MSSLAGLAKARLLLESPRDIVRSRLSWLRRSVAEDAVLNGAGILQSDRDYDWLGPGAYFWESDPLRAMEWAKWKSKRGEYNRPAVIGAVIDLGNCP